MIFFIIDHRIFAQKSGRYWFRIKSIPSPYQGRFSQI